MRITAKYLKSVYDDGTYGLRDVNLDIGDGKFAVVVGPSGCGKTTLLKVIAGLRRQSSGELYFDGLSAAKIPARDRKIAMVFQEYLLYPKYTVWENLSLALEREHLSREEEETRISDALAMFGMERLAGQLPRVLSGGQQQRVALAKAVVTRPEAILFDEPLANIAEAQRAEYVEQLKNLKKKMPDTTFVYVTHKIGEALQLADMLVVMNDGVVLQSGSKHDVTEQPCSAAVLDALTDEALTKDGNKVYNPYAKSWQTFDESRGRLFFDGEFDGKSLNVCGKSSPAEENLILRFAGDYGKVRVAVPAEKVRASRADGDIVLPQGDGEAYVSQDDVTLYDGDGRLLTAHYRLYDAHAVGRAMLGKLRLPCGSLTAEGVHGSAEVIVRRCAVAKEDNHGLIVERCLDEQSWNGGKLCYCVLKGFDRYLSLVLPPEANLFVGKHRVAIDSQYITIK